MGRITIDFGIDLGTTNSAIAVAQRGEIEVIDNNQEKITPSMVYIDKKGKIHRGKSAANNLTNPLRAADVAYEFKRVMGQKHVHTFEDAGRSMSPEELSAEILRDLRSAAEVRFGSSPTAAVITVPAMFELPQNDATMRAAKAAGFDHAILLQEPVAAATAYGYQTTSDRAYWLVYDFGGGTFDVSIVSVRDGTLSVIKHGGDNYLGGADFDRLIMDKCIMPSLLERYDLAALAAGADRLSRGRRAVLKPIAEEVKKSLSRRDSEEVFREAVFEDDSGEPVDIELQLSRSQFEDLIRSRVDASIEIARQVMADKGLSAKDCERILLVGGTTFVPLVRASVASLGIPLSVELDPMTVVSYGAAVFASSQRMPATAKTAVQVVAGTAVVHLEHDLVTKEPTPTVGGRVEIGGSPADEGVTVEIRRSDDGWKSGVVRVESGGMFFCEVMMNPEQRQSTFMVVVRDASGTQVKCTPESFAITCGMSVGKASLPQGVSIGLADGTAVLLIAEGASLPATSETRVHRFVRPLVAGSLEKLQIPIQSGSESDSSFNLTGTMFELRGTNIRRDIPAGSELEIVASVDQSGTTVVSFTVPTLDETFEVVQESALEPESADTMRDQLAGLRSSLGTLRGKAAQAKQHEVVRKSQELESSGKLDEIDSLITDWESGDRVAAGQARGQLVAAHKRVRDLEGLAEWPALQSEWKELLDQTRRLVHQHGDADERARVDSIVQEGARAIEARDPRMLERATDQLKAVGVGVLQRDPSFWAAMLSDLAKEQAKFTDQAQGRRLMAEGAAAMRRQDGSALQSIVQQLFRLLPPDVAQRAQSTVHSDVQ